MKKNILFCLLYLCIFIANAKTYTLSPPFQINGGYAPGDTLLLPNGLVANSVRWVNLHGTAENPIVIMNTGGRVELRGGLAEGIKILNCSYLKISGNGYEGTKYGIYISYTANGLPGINIKDRSHHIEIEHVEIENTGFSGIMAKDDVANNVDTSAAYWKMEGLYFHHNYIHDLRLGEGLYIGSTQWTRGSLQAGSHDIDDIRIYNNILVNTPSEAIQVGACPNGNVEIHDNDIKNYGTSPFEAYQANGIQLGNGFAGRCYNNRIIDGTSTGIIVLGIGDIYVYNNLIVRSGALGIFSGHQTAEEGKSFYYYHNTIIDPGTYAIQFRAPNNNTGYFYNNIVLTGKDKSSTIRQPAYLQYPLLIEGNYSGTMDDVEDLFVDNLLDDYRLINTAPAIDNGAEISSIGLSLDYDIVYSTRPTGTSYDIGAYEYIADTLENQPPVAITDSNFSLTLPASSFSINGGESYDPDSLGYLTSYEWIVLSDSVGSSFDGIDSPILTVTDLVAGVYMFQLVVTDNHYATDTATISVTVKRASPVVYAGGNQNIYYPTSSISLNGHATSSNGHIISYEWQKQSGPIGYSASGWNASELVLTNLIPGEYTFTLTATDNAYIESTDSMTLRVYGLYAHEELYRINCGGVQVSGSPIPWEKDMQVESSTYLAFGSGNYTTGSLGWRGTNTTQAPDSLFGGQRHQPSYANPIAWHFPVDSGWYEVRLYFAVKSGFQGSAPGERVFSVNIENEQVLTNYDIYTDVGLAATVKPFMVEVNDGQLSIDFVRHVGNTQINAIEIVSAEFGLGERKIPNFVYNAAATSASATTRSFNWYPNPTSGKVWFEVLDNNENAHVGKAELSLVDPQGKTVYVSNHTSTWGTELSNFADFSKVPPGIYIVHLKYADQYYFQRVIITERR